MNDASLTSNERLAELARAIVAEHYSGLEFRGCSGLPATQIRDVLEAAPRLIAEINRLRAQLDVEISEATGLAREVGRLRAALELLREGRLRRWLPLQGVRDHFTEKVDMFLAGVADETTPAPRWTEDYTVACKCGWQGQASTVFCRGMKCPECSAGFVPVPSSSFDYNAIPVKDSK